MAQIFLYLIFKSKQFRLHKINVNVLSNKTISETRDISMKLS